MSYITNKILRKKFEAGLQRTIGFIKKNPFVFLNESDIKCYLFSELFKEPLFRKKINIGGTWTTLLRSEYRFICKYGRGLHDIVVLDYSKIDENGYFTSQKVLIGCELKYKYFRSLENIFYHLDNDVSVFQPSAKHKDAIAKYGYIFFIHYARKKSDDKKYQKIVTYIKKLRMKNPLIKFYFLEIREDIKRSILIYPPSL